MCCQSFLPSASVAILGDAELSDYTKMHPRDLQGLVERTVRDTAEIVYNHKLIKYGLYRTKDGPVPRLSTRLLAVASAGLTWYTHTDSQEHQERKMDRGNTTARVGKVGWDRHDNSVLVLSVCVCCVCIVCVLCVYCVCTAARRRADQRRMPRGRGVGKGAGDGKGTRKWME